MNLNKSILLGLSTLCLFFTSCSNDDDASNTVRGLAPTILTPTVNNQINSFIYRGLNTFYLYKDEQPLLTNNRFTTVDELNNFTNESGSPENFFETLTVSRDRFSWIVSDFNELERNFAGISLDSGLKFNLFRFNEGEGVYGSVTQVIPNSPAEIAGARRGQLFTEIDGKLLDINNFRELFDKNSYTLGLADIIDNTFTGVNRILNITKIELTENPIALSKVLDVEGQKIGYLLYNSFIRGSEEELNIVFADFKAAGITNLVLDLRYNGGGSVNTAIALSGMITGQFDGQVFFKEQWNNDIQNDREARDPNSLITNLSNITSVAKTPLNTLGLTKLYVIGTKRSTASSSELIINGLRPYIDVVLIGDELGTVGKSQASFTVYDSDNFRRENANTSHTYAMQPLVFKSVNKDNVGVPNDGILPDISAREDITNLGILGDINEPLLSKAIEDITGQTALAAKRLVDPIEFGEYIGSDDMNSPTYQRMYVNP